MREVYTQIDTKPATMGYDCDSTSTNGLASSMETCLSGRKSSSTRTRQDLVRTTAALWLWSLPNGLLILGTIFATSRWNGHPLPATLTGALLTIGTAWMGVACYWNGRRCGRTHCKIDGVLLPLLSLVGLVNLVGVTAFSWMVYAGAFWIILLLSFVPEFFGRMYLTT